MNTFKKRLYFLQVLRAFAASLVVVDHSLMKMSLPSPYLGAFGVYIFFVISGFIIFHTLADKFNRVGGAREFLVRRYTRVAPMYYIATLAILLIDLENGKGQHTFIQVLTSFLFVPYWRPQEILMRPNTRSRLDTRLRNVFLHVFWTLYAG